MELVDADGENRAVRSFLLLYHTPSVSVGNMVTHMRLSGWEETTPDWAKEGDRSHLVKAAAQAWLRHLFGLEKTIERARLEGYNTAMVWNGRSAYQAKSYDQIKAGWKDE